MMSEKKKMPVGSSSSSQLSRKVQNGQFQAPLRIKILSIGSTNSGKSCLIKRYCEERFVSKYIATIGVDYGVKPVVVDGVDVRVNFWDLSGMQEFFEIRNEFYKETQGCLLVYDVTSRDSFEECDNWLAEAAKFGANPKEIPITLCGNKIDKKRVITEEEGRQYATSRGLQYYETSANTGDNVQDMFKDLFQISLRKMMATTS